MTINTLSSYNTAADVQVSIAEALNRSADLSALGYKVLAENALDIDFQIKNALQKVGMAIVVMTPKMSLQGSSLSATCYAFDEIDIIATEYVPVNRASNKAKAATALDVAAYIAEFLAGRQSPIGYGKMSFINLEQSEDDGLLVVNAKYKAYTLGSTDIPALTIS